jgi:hypothetical protein
MTAPALGIRSGVAAARPQGTVGVVGGGRAGLDPIAVLIKSYAYARARTMKILIAPIGP